jgi:hypothetical protein
MTGIDWQAIGTNLDAVASPSIVAGFFAMAWLAERLQFTQSKFIPIAAMWFDVIHNGSCTHAPLGQTHAAEGLDAELVGSELCPAGEIVPAPPIL